MGQELLQDNVIFLTPNVKLSFSCDICHKKHHILYIHCNE